MSTAGTFSGTIAVSSEATKGKTSASVKVVGSAKGALVPTPTATPCIGGTPTATPSATMTPTPTATATVGAGNSIFVTNFNKLGGSVTSYPVTGNGNIAPSINIEGSDTALSQPAGIALDSKGNIYIANEIGGLSGDGSVTEYADGNNGNATPIATISGPDTGLTGGIGEPYGIALDAGGNIYVTFGFTIIEYPAGSNGDTTPMATISLTAEGLGIAVDQLSGNIFVVLGYGGGVNSVVEYAAGSRGAATPIAIIAGSNTGLGDTGTFVEAFGLALNPVNGDIYVAAYPGSGANLGMILVYAAGTNGNIEPKAAIEGPDTGLDLPQAVALDSSGTIYVATIGISQSITVYPPGSNGNVTPSATIEGSNTGLGDVFGIVIGP